MKPEECGFEWRDGWGEHRCHLLAGHAEGNIHARHRCPCDFETTEARQAAR